MLSTGHCCFLTSHAVWCPRLSVHHARKIDSGNSQRFPWRTTGGETPCDCSERKRNKGGEEEVAEVIELLLIKVSACFAVRPI